MPVRTGSALKSWVFKSFLKGERDAPALVVLGSSFHQRGTTTENSLDCRACLNLDCGGNLKHSSAKLIELRIGRWSEETKESLLVHKLRDSISHHAPLHLESPIGQSCESCQNGIQKPVYFR